MMVGFFLAALLPWLYWDQGPGTANAVKQAGIERVYVPADQVAAWTSNGFAARPFDVAQFIAIKLLGIEFRIDRAGATSLPWVDGNGWRFERGGGHQYYYNVPWRKATLAEAEAYVYGADAAVHPDPRDLTAFGKMLEFLRSIDGPPLPLLANIAIVDDGSAETGEVLNLLARRNLMFRVVPAPDPTYDLNVQIGSKEYPKTLAADPSSFAALVRQKLTDDKRLLRIFGSEVVLGRIMGDSERVRVHLLNYGGGAADGLRVRVRGIYRSGALSAFGVKNGVLSDFAVSDGGTEFTIPEMGVYAVVDLRK